MCIVCKALFDGPSAKCNPCGGSNVRLLAPPPAPPSDVGDVLVDALERLELFEGVVIIALRKDGMQEMRTSTMSAYQKCYLAAFHQAVMLRWFEEIQDEE